MRVKLISPLRPAVLEGESRRLHVPDHADPARRADRPRHGLAPRTTARTRRLELDLRPGIVLVVGQNGAGKTNLLEALHVGTQGFSPRTRTDAQLIRFGERGALGSRSRVERGRGRTRCEVTVAARRRRSAPSSNGARLPSPEPLRRAFSTLVFTPDRLAVVKGAPAARRAYFDRVLGRLQPARAGLPHGVRGGARAAQRLAAPRAARAARPRRARALDGARRRARRAARRGARGRRSRCSRRLRRRAPASSGWRTRAPLRRRAADRRRRSRRASTPISSAARPGSGPHLRRRRASPPASATCAASARRESSGSPCSRCSSPRRSC